MDHRDGYEVGATLYLCCEIDSWCVKTTVSEKRTCSLREVTEEELRRAGYRNHYDVIDKLKKFYPDINFSSIMTVVRWGALTGKLIDDYVKWVMEEEIREPI